MDKQDREIIDDLRNHVKDLKARKYDENAIFWHKSVIRIVDTLESENAQLKAKAREVCVWKRRYSEDPYEASCGLYWNWTLEENFAFCDMNYCPKCGRKIKEIKGR